MVHALREARRVLRPGGALVDLRPAPVHRRVGLLRAGRYLHLGTMRERFDDDYAADRAVAEMMGRGLFRAERRVRFACNRTMDSLKEFRAWLGECLSLGKLPPHDWLVGRVAAARRGEYAGAKIRIAAPVDLRVLRRA